MDRLLRIGYGICLGAGAWSLFTWGWNGPLAGALVGGTIGFLLYISRIERRQG
jgi:hypothetical protein